ncbi:MAG: FliI/YscN family ATPase [Dactylosporangium sp.]|nr:FliI/YscN family ATPase [Dactylosporangium sp.]NNJ60350.1 FliI/YscN family ATPase [Dactylosporangium sp.]
MASAAPRCHGRVTSVIGLAVTVAGISGNVGDLVHIGESDAPVPAEVVAIDGDQLRCLPLGALHGVGRNAPVFSTDLPLRIPVGGQLRGRVLDGLGRPIDGGPPIHGPGAPADAELVFVENEAPQPLARGRVGEALSLGVRAIDTMATCGRGQRMGIFSGSGVGKSSLLSMITRGTEARISVIALVGERGREVREFIANDLGPEGLARSVVVVATSDQPPLVRLRAGFVATRIAEWFRDTGDDVLLLMDSLTRTAMAQREVGLSVGEPPATRGYPPSVFALLARLLERAGPAARGSITGLYTVLVNGDDHNEPIADAARSILDGHIVLDRRLATAGHFPSIDVLESVSRVAGAVTTPDQRQHSTALRRLLAAHRDVRELIEIGAYVPGTNVEADEARAMLPAIERFLRQDLADQTPAAAAWAALDHLLRKERQT